MRKRERERAIKITFEGRKSPRLKAKTKWGTDDAEARFPFLQGETFIQTRMLFLSPPATLTFKIKTWRERSRVIESPTESESEFIIFL